MTVETAIDLYLEDREKDIGDTIVKGLTTIQTQLKHLQKSLVRIRKLQNLIEVQF